MIQANVLELFSVIFAITGYVEAHIQLTDGSGI